MRADVEKEINRILPLIPKTPPEGTVDILRKRGYLNDERLLYRISYEYDEIQKKKVKAVKVKCSCCQGEDVLEYVGNDQGCHRGYGAPFGFIDPLDKSAVTSGGTCVCPVCGKGLRALHIGSFKSCTEIDSRICMSVHNVDGRLAMLSWVIKKFLHSDGSVSYFYNGYEGIVIVEKTIVRIKMYSKFMSSYSWCSDWMYTKKYDDQLGTFSRQEIVEASPLVVEQTDCAHSALAEYLNGTGELFPARYIQLWLKHPNVENLTRQGFSRYISAVIEKSISYNGSYYTRSFNIKETERFVNWSKVKPSDMLGLSKDELELARSVSFEALDFYKDIKKSKGLRLDKDMLCTIEKWNLYSVRSLIFAPVHGYFAPLIHTINYLERQKASAMQKGIVSIQYLEDYWNALFKVYRSMPRELLWPRDLIRAHDQMVLRVKEKEDAKLNAKIASRLEELSDLTYKDEELGFFIRPAESQGELIKEGKLLHHCVGGYASAYADGKTVILFIRRINDPEIPFYTLEYKNGSVQQNRGDHNCARTSEIIEFEKKWLEHIKDKEFVKNEKRNSRSKAEHRAGAA